MELKKISFSVYVLMIMLLLGACSNDDSENGMPGEPIGPISAEEFESVPIPTYAMVVAAYKEVTTAEPTLLKEEDKLTIAVFNWIKANPEADANGRTGRTAHVQASYFDMANRLTKEEWKVVLLNMIDAGSSVSAVGTSLTAAQDQFPCDSDVGFTDGKADALRHAYWNILMASKSNAKFAKDFSTAHESEAADASSKAMDLHNNQVGLALKQKYPMASDAQLLELLTQHSFVFVENPSAGIPTEAVESLVYFKGKRPYDGMFMGSMTNPDSGGPWTAQVHLNQCGKILRGELNITRSESSQKRRFEGVQQEDGTALLTIFDPYEFENPQNLSYCRTMKLTLSGNENSLSGNWTSSNCSKGGVLDIAR